MVVDVHASGLVDVSFPDGLSTIHGDELVGLDASPADRLIQGEVCAQAVRLQDQWQLEQESKFNERFEIVNGFAAKHMGGRANPFKSYDDVICSHSFAIRQPRTAQIAEAPWDSVIFDEAHLYELAVELKDQRLPNARANAMVAEQGVDTFPSVRSRPGD